MNLADIRSILREGMSKSGSLSYGRRAPAEEARPYLEEARSRLEDYVIEFPEDASAWRDLSLAEECLLNYGAAVSYLERAMKIGGRDKKSLSRLFALKESKAEWGDLPLTPEELRELGEYLSPKLVPGQIFRDLRFTEEWLGSFDSEKKAAVLSALRRRGAYTDFMVYSNVVNQ